MFIETVRRYLETQGSERPGWVGGSRDPLVGHALALLHGSPAAPWTLSSLAGEVGASRSALAQRFTGLVGQPPMRYLAAWRMHMAGRLLSDQDAKVSDVARRVGYESEAAFSRAFKRATGASPAAWRGPRNA
jgi:AraC-like DNA-binding protein